MKREIRFSQRAKNNLEKLLSFLETEWSAKVMREFVSKLDSALFQIDKHPKAFPASEKIKNLRKCVITKQTTLFYQFDSKHIYVVMIFDTRQDPDKIKG